MHRQNKVDESDEQRGTMFFGQAIVIYILAPIFYGLGCFSVKFLVMLINSIIIVGSLSQRLNDAFGLLEVIVGLAVMIYGSRYLWREMKSDQKQKSTEETSITKLS